jgi:hypothetical protein
MLFLSAVVQLSAPREIEPNDLLAATRNRIGHVGLTVIALVFVLMHFWQQ